MSAILVLVRHGESEWNARNVWTGLTDVSLTQKGKDEAKQAAALVADIPFDISFTSRLTRAGQTLGIILSELHLNDIPVMSDAALNERDYGIFTGKNKSEIKSTLGDTEFLQLRRGWDYPVPDGESLKQVYARVSPYFDTAILPEIRNGKNIIVVAHGNSLRALIKKLERISDTDIPMVELATGEAVVYRFNDDGVVVSHERRGSRKPSDAR